MYLRTGAVHTCMQQAEGKVAQFRCVFRLHESRQLVSPQPDTLYNVVLASDAIDRSATELICPYTYLMVTDEILPAIFLD